MKSYFKNRKWFSRMLELEHGLATTIWIWLWYPTDRDFELAYGLTDAHLDAYDRAEIEPIFHPHREEDLKRSIRGAIRAAFELGYIEQAMRCKQALAKIGYEI